MHIELNKHGVNKKIKANILSDEKMRTVGFTDYSKDKWYFSKPIKGVNDITFNISINKNDADDLRIDILDEDFGQPYDYQTMLENNPKFKPCLIVKEQVEYWMKHLEDNRVLNGHVLGEYI